MENSGNGLNIRHVQNRVVVASNIVQENVTNRLQQMVVQTVLVQGLKGVNVLSHHVL